jgi:hypothetical protein
VKVLLVAAFGVFHATADERGQVLAVTPGLPRRYASSWPSRARTTRLTGARGAGERLARFGAESAQVDREPHDRPTFRIQVTFLRAWPTHHPDPLPHRRQTSIIVSEAGRSAVGRLRKAGR